MDLNVDISGQYDSVDVSKAGRLSKTEVTERETWDGVITCPNNLSNVRSMYDVYLGVDDWKTVTEDALYVYSAHADPRGDGYSIIRIFGIMKSADIKNKAKSHYCHIYSEGSRYSVCIEAQLFTLSGHYKTR